MPALMRSSLLFLALSPAAFGGMASACDSAPETRVARAVEFISIWESRQTDLLDTITTSGAVYRDTPNLHDYVGADIASYFNHVHGWSDDTRITIQAASATPCGAIVEWTVSGIQARAIGDRMPWASNRPWQFEGVTVFSFEDDRISRAVDYYDVATFMAQIGFAFHPPVPDPSPEGGPD
ncbi:nuclear transport factor 2 family protein [Hyphobacterium sp.]|jgi:steroid delta-isomerase-like uncharacterized protein|uniref:nuclear transport factor 2 family protein n=1 Tax=Hyphobacterium sp. TaxID=2004662 RepID=UPI003BAB8EDF